MQLYERANELFYQDLGAGSLGQMMEKYQSVGYQLHNTSRILAGLKDELMEKGEVKGASCCGYPNFLDVYHVITRMGERFHIQSLVLICSLEEVSEDSQMTSGQIEPIMEQLSQVITEQLRTGDVYTRYRLDRLMAEKELGEQPEKTGEESGSVETSPESERASSGAFYLGQGP